MIKTLLSTLAILFALGADAFAHSDVIERCIAHKKIAKIGDSQVLPNGLVIEMYDTNGNGKPDIATLSTHIGGDAAHTVTPTFIITNYNEDDESDQVFIDKKGDGNCSDIVLYIDFNTPSMKPTTPNMDTNKQVGL